MEPWFEDHSRVVEFVAWAMSTGRAPTARDVFERFEKPWHYEEEYAAYRADVFGEERTDG